MPYVSLRMCSCAHPQRYTLLDMYTKEAGPINKPPPSSSPHLVLFFPSSSTPSQLLWLLISTAPNHTQWFFLCDFSLDYFYAGLGAAPTRWGQGAAPLQAPGVKGTNFYFSTGWIILALIFEVVKYWDKNY